MALVPQDHPLDERAPGAIQGGVAADQPDPFGRLSNESLADIWYAMAGAEIRHPGCFTKLLEAANDALVARLGDTLAEFVEKRFRGLRPVDAAEDAMANARATSETSCDDRAVGLSRSDAITPVGRDSAR